jgi:hypothetical protein
MERYTRIDLNTPRKEVLIDDPEMYTRPFTIHACTGCCPTRS